MVERNGSGLRNPYVLLAVRLVMAGIMLVAAVPKFFDWEAEVWKIDFEPFARIVYNYRVLPTPLVNLVAMAIPPVETIGALSLLTGIWLRSGSLLLAILQTVFLLGMGQAWARGLDIHCGCFVGVDSKVGLWTMLRDSLFLLGFLWVFWGTFSPSSTTDTSPSETTETD